MGLLLALEYRTSAGASKAEMVRTGGRRGPTQRSKVWLPTVHDGLRGDALPGSEGPGRADAGGALALGPPSRRL